MCLYIPVFNNPKKFEILTSKKMLFSGCICVSLNNEYADKINIGDIHKCILSQIDKIQEQSSVRGSGWIGLSTTTIGNISIQI
jgi:hypothetical protein